MHREQNYTSGNQRWRERRAVLKPASPIRTEQYDVAAIAGDAVPRDFVEKHHYSGSYPAARRRFGLYYRTTLVGVAVFSHPCNDAVLAPFRDSKRSVELGRFVLLDSVPGNGETWFLARCFEGLRQEGFMGVVSFSDPIPRTTASGEQVFPGHVGTIYQAHNARHLGRSTPRTLRVLPDGTVLSSRAISKIRSLDQGWEYAAKLLYQFGASPVTTSYPHAWVTRWVNRLTTPLRHPGNFKYAWGLDRRTARSLPSGKAYPKRLA